MKWFDIFLYYFFNISSRKQTQVYDFLISKKVNLFFFIVKILLFFNEHLVSIMRCKLCTYGSLQSVRALYNIILNKVANANHKTSIPHCSFEGDTFRDLNIINFVDIRPYQMYPLQIYPSFITCVLNILRLNVW